MVNKRGRTGKCKHIKPCRLKPCDLAWEEKVDNLEAEIATYNRWVAHKRKSK